MRKKIPLIGGIINLIESLKGDIGIIENTDVATHSISAGSYVIWKNELYKASSAISVDDALSSSNLTAVSGGAANEINNKMLKFYNMSGSSNGDGDIGINDLTPQNANIVAAFSTSNNIICHPYKSGSVNYALYITNQKGERLSNSGPYDFVITYMSIT